jgi:hypothetical protein
VVNDPDTIDWRSRPVATVLYLAFWVALFLLIGLAGASAHP